MTSPFDNARFHLSGLRWNWQQEMQSVLKSQSDIDEPFIYLLQQRIPLSSYDMSDLVQWIFQYVPDREDRLHLLRLSTPYYQRTNETVYMSTTIQLYILLPLSGESNPDVRAYLEALIPLGLRISLSTHVTPILISVYLDVLISQKKAPNNLAEYLFRLPAQEVIRHLVQIELSTGKLPINSAIVDLCRLCIVNTVEPIEHRQNLFLTLLSHQYRPHVIKLFDQLMSHSLDPGMRELLMQSDLKISLATYLKYSSLGCFYQFRQKLYEHDLLFALDLTPDEEQYFQDWQDGLPSRFIPTDLIEDLNTVHRGDILRICFLSPDILTIGETILQVTEVIDKGIRGTAVKTPHVHLSNGFIICTDTTQVLPWLQSILNVKTVPYYWKRGKLHSQLLRKVEYVRLLRHEPSLADRCILVIRRHHRAKKLQGNIPGELYERIFPEWMM